MVELSEQLYDYIELSYTDMQRANLYNGFGLLERFGLPFYEDKYMNVIYSADNLDLSEHKDIIYNMMQEDIALIISRHGIELTLDPFATLMELNEIASCLLLLPNLEDKSIVRYRVNSDTENKMILCELLEYYTSLSVVKCLDIIDSVSDGLINTIRDMVKEEPDLEELDKKHLKYISLFFTYIGETDCLGKQLYNKGYGNKLTLEELIKLESIDLEKDIQQGMLQPAKVALDILSLMMITKGEFDLPVNKFSHNSELFTNDHQVAGKLVHVMNSIMNDFNTYLTAARQEEAMNGNHN